MNKKILATGGDGLGFHIYEKLLAEGHDITYADNLFTISKGNIFYL